MKTGNHPDPAPPVWAPQSGPQTSFVESDVFEVVYGGARGGGKTDAALGDFARHAAHYAAGARGLLVRRTRVALEPTIARAREIFAGAQWTEQKSRFTWPNGARLSFRHLDQDSHADAYQGHDYSRVYIEELTQFGSPRLVDKLKATLRSATGVPCRFRATCNPGGPGHNWVKDRYIDAGEYEVVVDDFTNPFDGRVVRLDRTFIPARLSDNPKLTATDPLYIARLQQSGSAQIVRAWLEGDWNIVEGAFFDKWRIRNIVKPFQIPADWPRFRSFDWGYAAPFSVGWWAMATEPFPTSGVTIPRGALVRYREWYGSNSRPNEGLKLTAEDVAHGIATRERGETISKSVADPSIFSSDGGPSLAERMSPICGLWKRADNARVGRNGALGGWDQMRKRIVGDGTTPMLFVFDTCRDFIRTVPVLQHDPDRPEDLDTNSEDHVADEARYACMSRPLLSAVANEDQAVRDFRFGQRTPMHNQLEGSLMSADLSTSPGDLHRLKSYFSDAQALTQEARQMALVAIDYYDSDQFTREELNTLAMRGQPAITVNRIKPAINSIIGVTERGRSEPRAWPRNPRDAGSADAATDVLRYIADFNRFKRLKQDCFRDLLVPGSCAALVGVDSDSQVTVTQVRWEEFFHDPRSRRQDFKDARFLGVAKWMYADDAQTLYPEKAGEIVATLDTASGGGSLNTDQSYQDRPLQGALSAAWVDPKQRRLMIVEMYLKDGGAWRRCVFTGGDVLEDGPSPYLDHRGRPDCPIEAMSAYVKRNNDRYGAVWDMIGPQDEINKRRSKSVHLLSTTRIEVRDPQAIDVDADVARREASRPDGVIPYGWGLAPNTVEFQGNMEMLQEAKAEIERMGPSPAMLGRSNDDASGRALLARQQSGLVELGNLYGGLEDWELRIYRQCWARAKQFWRAPQFIRVTDDEDTPKFVGLNQPVTHPVTGAVLGYANRVAEMDVDIEIDVQADTGTIQQEAFIELLQLVGSSPIYQQQAPLSTLIQLSPIPHKRAILDAIKQAGETQARAALEQRQVAQAAEAAKIAEISARAQLHGATGFAKTLDSLTYAHDTHAGIAARGLEAGVASAA